MYKNIWLQRTEAQLAPAYMKITTKLQQQQQIETHVRDLTGKLLVQLTESKMGIQASGNQESEQLTPGPQGLQSGIPHHQFSLNLSPSHFCLFLCVGILFPSASQHLWLESPPVAAARFSSSQVNDQRKETSSLNLNITGKSLEVKYPVLLKNECYHYQ